MTKEKNNGILNIVQTKENRNDFKNEMKGEIEMTLLHNFFEERLEKALINEKLSGNSIETIGSGEYNILGTIIEVVNPIRKDFLKEVVNAYLMDDFQNRFDILGSGSYGYVYGFDEYAIKFIYDISEMEFACNDVEVLKSLSHLNFIPKLYAVIDDIVLIVERVFGKTVMDYVVMPNNPYNINESILDEFESALFEIIKCGYTPYDLHRGNVMIDKNGRIKIVDVGFFKLHEYDGDIHEYYKHNDGYKEASFTLNSLKDYVYNIANSDTVAI